MTDVRLPKAIQEEVERAEEIERQIAAMLDPDSVYAQTQEASPPEEPVGQETVAEQETPADTPQEPPSRSLEPQDDPNSETWQSRYQALQGKYNAEVPRLHQQVRELTQAVQQLETRLSAEPPAPAQEAHDLDARYKEAAELFGEDLVKFTREMAQAEADRRIAELKQSQQLVEQRIAQSENERFFAQVDAAVPGWRDVDSDPAWLGWLQEYDPLLGAPRQAALEQAAHAHDVQRIAYLFQTFLGTRRPPAVAQPPQPSRAQLEQVTPRPVGNASTPMSSQVRVYSQAEIQQLLDPRYISRLPIDQQRAIERDIDLAVAEGRVAA